ncbi:hypothetical protein KR059_012174 [Drosophila kikkawai]|nr:hypothetical protein KR059_012174 [Drosophila kikkawai]
MDRYRTTNYIRSPKKGSLVYRSLDLRLQNAEAAYYLKWSCICLLWLIVLGIDLMRIHRSCCPEPRYRWVLFGFIFLAFIVLVYFVKYLHLFFKSDPVMGTEDQKRLLDGLDNNGVDTVLDLPKIEPPICETSDTLINESTMLLMRNYALRRCLSNQEPSQTLKAKRRTACPEDYLTDPCQLPALINRAKRERRLLEKSISVPEFQSPACREMSQRLRNTAYKLSPAPVSNRPITFEEFGTAHTQKGSTDPARFSSQQIMQYVVNLRTWIQTTILKRLVRELDFVNNVMQQRGFVGFEIGTVSLDTLRRTVEGQRIMLPALPAVLAFLNITGDQLYVVQRIRELEKSAPNSWNSGVRVPTDAAIIFHLFCVYLDTQLMPFEGSEPPFSSRYVVQGNAQHSIRDIIKAVNNYANFAFLVTNDEDHRRPRFDFICGGELHRCADQRGSPYQVIIEFLMHLRQHQDSTLEGVSLNKNGINIMWVIGES